MTPEELLHRLEKDIRYKKPYGFMTEAEQYIYEAELECLNLARKNIANDPINGLCPRCKSSTTGFNYCSNCGQRLKE